MVNEIPTSDVMLFLGDLNARVGSAIGSNDVWRGVRGRHGVGRCNQAGEECVGDMVSVGVIRLARSVWETWCR